MYSELLNAIKSGDKENLVTVLHNFLGDNEGHPYEPIKYSRDTWKCAEVRLQLACEREDPLGDVIAHAVALLGFLSPEPPQTTENNEQTDYDVVDVTDSDSSTSTTEGGEPS